MSRARIAGFTLIELMVTLAVLAILVALAGPSFQQTLRLNRVATTTNEMLASLSLARSEAIRSTVGSNLCASKSGSACDGDDWNDGWMIWTDVGASGLGTYGSDDKVIRYVQPRSQMQISTDEVAALGFDSRGRMIARNNTGGTLAVGDQTFSIQPDICPEGQQLVRELTVSKIGQARVQPRNCSK